MMQARHDEPPETREFSKCLVAISGTGAGRAHAAVKRDRTYRWCMPSAQ